MKVYLEFMSDNEFRIPIALHPDRPAPREEPTAGCPWLGRRAGFAARVHELGKAAAERHARRKPGASRKLYQPMRSRREGVPFNGAPLNGAPMYYI